MKNTRYDVVIIGGGHNGLVCAYYLARAGLKVKICERRSIVGGAAVTEEFFPGFKNSVASYTVSLLNPQVIKDMQLAEHGLKIVKRPISNFLPTERDEYLLLGGSLERTQTEFRKYSSHDADQLPRYYQRLEDVADVLRQLSVQTPPNPRAGLKGGISAFKQMWPLARGSNALQQDVFDLFTKSARGFLDNWFEADLPKAAFGFDAVVGNYASPDTPGSAYVLLHHVFGEVNGEKGAWGHALGGMGAITSAMRMACERVGVEILVDAPVDSVLLDGKKVAGVKLESGDEVLATQVVANVNPKLLFEKMISPNELEEDFLTRIKNYKCGSGTFRMNVALSELPDFSCLPGVKLAEHHLDSVNR